MDRVLKNISGSGRVSGTRWTLPPTTLSFETDLKPVNRVALLNPSVHLVGCMPLLLFVNISSNLLQCQYLNILTLKYLYVLVICLCVYILFALYLGYIHFLLGNSSGRSYYHILL